MNDQPNQQEIPARRGFISTFLMLIGLLAGYGMGALHFFRYLVPLRKEPKRREMFIGTIDEFPIGTSVTIKDPRGQEIAVARISDDPEHGFKALSSKCPHLGCKVHWVGSREEFYCPCHQGVFDKQGIAVSGPPAAENKNLPTYEVRVNPETGWVMVMVSAEQTYGV